MNLVCAMESMAIDSNPWLSMHTPQAHSDNDPCSYSSSIEQETTSRMKSDEVSPPVLGCSDNLSLTIARPL
jgi:hypothetical protein